MANWLNKVAPRASQARPAVRVATPALARHLDDLRLQAEDFDNDVFFGRVPPPPGPFEGIAIPADPVAAQRAVAAAPEAWLREAQRFGGLVEEPQIPLIDMLRQNERSRALVRSRLDRLTPEQRQSSLQSVALQAEDDARAAAAARRAAGAQYQQDLRTAGAVAAAGLLGGGAMYGRMSQLADEAARAAASNPTAADLGPDMRGRIEDAMPMRIDLGEDLPDLELPEIDTSDIPIELAAIQSEPDIFADDQLMDLSPDTPAQAVAAAPGPEIPVRRERSLEELPGPQRRSIAALMRAGIPEGRATNIILRGASMSPDEYRMVTGGGR